VGRDFATPVTEQEQDVVPLPQTRHQIFQTGGTGLPQIAPQHIRHYRSQSRPGACDFILDPYRIKPLPIFYDFVRLIQEFPAGVGGTHH
jgi:hypothetical protein